MLAVVVAGPIESNNIAGAMEIKLLIKFWSQKWTLAFFNGTHLHVCYSLDCDSRIL